MSGQGVGLTPMASGGTFFGLTRRLDASGWSRKMLRMTAMPSESDDLGWRTRPKGLSPSQSRSRPSTRSPAAGSLARRDDVVFTRVNHE